MATPPIGIDLGTSTSELCAFVGGKPVPMASPLSLARSPIVPSLVGWDKRREEIVVGVRANALRARQDAFIKEIKRKMGTDERVKLGNQAYRPQEIAAMILKRLVEGATPEVAGEITEAVISVPANFKDAARQATLDAASIAGLKVPLLIAEPTAAALAFGVQHLDADERVLVFDFGGGTLDVTLLQMCEGVMDVERVDGDAQLGGKDMDAVLMEWVRRRFAEAEPGAVAHPNMENELARVCEIAKVQLSTTSTVDLTLANYAARGGEPVELALDMSRADLERAIRPLLDRATACLRRVLEGDGQRYKRVDPRSISRVLMVGGTTYIPAVRQRVAEVMGRPVSIDVNPDLAVAMGACVRSAIAAGVAGGAQEIVLADVSPFSVGVEVAQPMNDGMILPGLFSPLIEKNAPIPHKSTHGYTLMHPEQQGCTVSVYQGNAAFVAENELIAKAQLNDIPPSLTDTPRAVKIDFSFDLSGIVSLLVTIPGTNIVARLEADPRQGRMSDAERVAAAARLDVSTPGPEASPSYARAKPLIERAEAVLRRETAAGAPRTAAALERLKAALVTGVEHDLMTAEDQLTDALIDEGT